MRLYLYFSAPRYGCVSKEKCSYARAKDTIRECLRDCEQTKDSENPDGGGFLLEVFGRLIDEAAVYRLRQKGVILESSGLKKNYFQRYQGLVDFISGTYLDSAEIGIGHFPDVAFALLKQGVRVFATDVRQFQYNGLSVILDDITEPDFFLYTSVDLIYSLRPPPELVPYIIRLAKAVSADVIVKPLTSDYAGGKMIRNGNTTFFFWEYYEKEERKEKSYS